MRGKMRKKIHFFSNSKGDYCSMLNTSKNYVPLYSRVKKPAKKCFTHKKMVSELFLLYCARVKIISLPHQLHVVLNLHTEKKEKNREQPPNNHCATEKRNLRATVRKKRKEKKSNMSVKIVYNSGGRESIYRCVIITHLLCTYHKIFYHHGKVDR
jgi:hypothetical protein